MDNCSLQYSVWCPGKGHLAHPLCFLGGVWAMRRTQALFRSQLNCLPTVDLGQISQLPLNWLLVVCGSALKNPHIFPSGKQDPVYFLTFPYFLCLP